MLATSAQAERRLAFVAGVNAYSNLPANMQLERAVADAETVSTTLQELGFTVTKLTSGVTHEAFLRRFGEFTAQIELNRVQFESDSSCEVGWAARVPI